MVRRTWALDPLALVTVAVAKLLGAHVRELRLAAAMTQEELAQAAGVTPKYVSELEHGKTNPTLVTLVALAEKGFGMPLSIFLAFDIGADEAREQVRELNALLSGQDRRMRVRLMRVIRAFIEPDR